MGRNASSCGTFHLESESLQQETVQRTRLADGIKVSRRHAGHFAFEGSAFDIRAWRQTYDGGMAKYGSDVPANKKVETKGTK
jgi:hypothetical protein